jgi:DMSO reductase anchor subunit
VAGLLFVVLAQGAAFFTMAKRAEAQNRLHLEQAHRIAALAFPHQTQANVENLTKADQEHKEANERLRRSDAWRGAGLLLFSLSLFAFVLGCGWGAYTVMVAKDRSVTTVDNIRK